jgi:hypothetical protein
MLRRATKRKRRSRGCGDQEMAEGRLWKKRRKEVVKMDDGLGVGVGELTDTQLLLFWPSSSSSSSSSTHPRSKAYACGKARADADSLPLPQEPPGSGRRDKWFEAGQHQWHMRSEAVEEADFRGEIKICEAKENGDNNKIARSNGGGLDNTVGLSSVRFNC